MHIESPTLIELFGSGDHKHPELPSITSSDAGIIIKVCHLELAAPRRVGGRSQSIGESRNVEGWQLRQAPRGLNSSFLKVYFYTRSSCRKTDKIS